MKTEIERLLIKLEKLQLAKSYIETDIKDCNEQIRFEKNKLEAESYHLLGRRASVTIQNGNKLVGKCSFIKLGLDLKPKLFFSDLKGNRLVTDSYEWI